MSNVSDLTIEVLKDIRAQLGELTEIKARMDGIHGELTEIRSELRSVNQRVDRLTDRVDRLGERVETGFDGVNHRLDSVLKIVGTHHTQLETRVRRIEDHLGLE